MTAATMELYKEAKQKVITQRATETTAISANALNLSFLRSGRLATLYATIKLCYKKCMFCKKCRVNIVFDLICAKWD